MIYIVLRQALNAIKKHSDEFWSHFEPTLFQREFEKGDLWQSKNEAGEKIGFLVNGSAKSYHKHPESFEKQTDRLWKADDFILNPTVVGNSLSECTIEFTETSHVIQFSLKSINEFPPEHIITFFDYLTRLFALEAEQLTKHIRWLKYERSIDRYDESVDQYEEQFKTLSNLEKGFYIGVCERTICDFKKKG